MRRIWFIAAAIAVSFALVATSAWAAITPVKVVVEPAAQYYAFGNDSYVAYNSNSKAHPDHWDALSIHRPSGAPAPRLNAAGTEGYVGGFDPGTNTALYQQVAGDASDLYFFDLDTRKRTKVPGVNTASWEWQPRISSSYIFFFRNYSAGGDYYTGLYLWNRAKKFGTRIEAYRWSKNAWLDAGSVGDRYASWTRCTLDTCIAYVYDTQSGRIRQIPSKNGRPQYAPTLDEANGLVFFVRSGFGCGVEVGFWSVPLSNFSAAPTKIASLPAGIDAGNMASLMPSRDGTENDLLFARIDCGRSTDIYALPGVSPLGP